MSIDEERAKSQAVWDEMATGWDTYRDYIWTVSRPVGEDLVRRLDPRPGQTILDIACGPGDTGFVAARSIEPDGRLIATDFAPEMVEVARKRAQELGVGNVEFKVMDAERMDLGDDSVDGILCRWGFMLMLDPGAAFKECRRVLRDGGRLAFSVWGAPQDNPWVTVYGAAMAETGYPPQNDPFAPGGMFSLADHDRIREMVQEAGFSEVEVGEVDVAWDFENFGEAWKFANELAGAIATLLKQLPPDEVERFRKTLEASMEQFRQGDGYRMPGRAVNVHAS